MEKIKPFIIIPLTLLFLIWGSSKAFALMSAASDLSVLLGVSFICVLAFVLYRFIIYIIQKPIN